MVTRISCKFIPLSVLFNTLDFPVSLEGLGLSRSVCLSNLGYPGESSEKAGFRDKTLHHNLQGKQISSLDSGVLKMAGFELAGVNCN